MKVRVEFPEHPEGSALDLESDFDVVEFTTAHAGSYEEWGWAVLDFVRTAGSRWNSERIILSAMTDEGGDSFDWVYFVGRLSETAKSDLRKALEESDKVIHDELPA